ncbi:phage holin family protein [Tissierellaceae bacterium HCP3S3_D8]
MTGEEILSFIQPEILILIPVLIILGVIGILLAILILGFENGFVGQVILNGILQGILAAGMAVYVHQLTIQSTRKRVEEDQD